MKCIKSKKYRKGTNEYEYLRVDDEKASKEVNSGHWEYIPKSEYKKKSRHYKFQSNKGTHVNAVDKDGNKAKKVINPTAYKAPKGTNSTKIGDGSLNNPNIVRKKKYDKPELTLEKVMKLPLKTFKEEGEVFESVKLEHTTLKARKEVMIKNFERRINPKENGNNKS